MLELPTIRKYIAALEKLKTNESTDVRRFARETLHTLEVANIEETLLPIHTLPMQDLTLHEQLLRITAAQVNVPPQGV